jgi:hypothetical protein
MLVVEKVPLPSVRNGSLSWLRRFLGRHLQPPPFGGDPIKRLALADRQLRVLSHALDLCCSLLVFLRPARLLTVPRLFNLRQLGRNNTRNAKADETTVALLDSAAM